jgi:hypothetical protein
VEGNGKTTAILLGVWATFALDVFSTLNSSPQTTELFAGDRENTLMHWVVIGDVAAISGGLIGTILSKKQAPLIGAVGIVVLMHVLYRHAVNRGQGQAPPSSGAWG